MIWIAYLIIGLTHLLGIVLGNVLLSLISKALLMPTLALLVVQRKYPSPWRTFILLALTFSWMGDMFLTQSDKFVFFICGIASFLLAQVSYIIHFRKECKQKERPTFIAQKPFAVIPYILYGLVLLALLFPKMELALKIPIALYATILLSMAAYALNRKNTVPTNSFLWVFVGAIFFVISDSLIAINKFLVAFEFSRFIIMLTYIIAQGMIIRGVLLHSNK